MIIKLLPAHLRPREKFLAQGPAKLSDAELLAILLRTGTRGKSTMDLAHELLVAFGGLRPLFLAEPKQLCSHKGIGITHYIQLKAAIEISKRHMKETLAHGISLNRPSQVLEYLKYELRDQTNECFIALFLDSQNRILSIETLFEGSITQAVVYPREIVRRCLQYNAAAVIFSHNHPSGNPHASKEDIEFTRRLKSLLQELDIKMLDHIIIGDTDYFSFAEMNKI